MDDLAKKFLDEFYREFPAGHFPDSTMDAITGDDRLPAQPPRPEDLPAGHPYFWDVC